VAPVTSETVHLDKEQVPSFSMKHDCDCRKQFEQSLTEELVNRGILKSRAMKLLLATAEDQQLIIALQRAQDFKRLLSLSCPLLRTLKSFEPEEDTNANVSVYQYQI
jgi:hypothetical protein